MGGGKSDKTCFALVEFYPEQRKIFLSELSEKMRPPADASADSAFVDKIKALDPKLKLLAWNVPLTLPKCFTCRLRCPGTENCDEPEISWMSEHQKKLDRKRAEKRYFTSYTERCVEAFLLSELEEPFVMQHALGANMAPLTARSLFLRKRLKTEHIEVFPRLSLWRIGQALQIQKSYLQFHKHSFAGQEAREAILKELVRREVAFLYEQDVRTMIENGNAFDAFLCALTGVLKFDKQVEKRPAGFPRHEGWVEIPKADIVW